MNCVAEMSRLQRMTWARETVRQVGQVGASGQGEDKKFVKEYAIILKDLGPRLHRWGFPAAVAFLLVRAAYNKIQVPSPRQKAHRILLQNLWGVTDQDWQRLFQMVSGAEQVTARQMENLEDSLLWLRRYAETLLPDVTDSAED